VPGVCGGTDRDGALGIGAERRRGAQGTHTGSPPVGMSGTADPAAGAPVSAAADPAAQPFIPPATEPSASSTAAGLELQFASDPPASAAVDPLVIDDVRVEDSATRTREPMQLSITPQTLTMTPNNGGPKISYPLDIVVRPQPGGGGLMGKGLTDPFVIYADVNVNGFAEPPAKMKLVFGTDKATRDRCVPRRMRTPCPARHPADTHTHIAHHRPCTMLRRGPSTCAS
jgi:hypothetical protein